MLAIISVFGVLIAGMSIWGLFRPQKVVALVRRVGLHDFGIIVAIGVRLLLGLALIVAAPSTPFPQIIFALGVIALLAAVVLVFMGQTRLSALINWFSSASTITLRTAFAFGAAFGGFLLFATI